MLVALRRTAAMVAPGQTFPVERYTLYVLCEELLGARWHRLAIR